MVCKVVICFVVVFVGIFECFLLDAEMERFDVIVVFSGVLVEADDLQEEIEVIEGLEGVALAVIAGESKKLNGFFDSFDLEKKEVNLG